MYRIAKTDHAPTIPDTLTDDAKDFLAQCFRRDPVKRPSATALLDHPWIRDVTLPRTMGAASGGTSAGCVGSGVCTCACVRTCAWRVRKHARGGSSVP